jgi:putative SOS response-associated peptidase YedK
MCGRFYLDAPQEILESYFNLQAAPALSPRYNIAPSQDVAAVILADQKRVLKMLHWGLIPFWAKDEKIGHHTINARLESVEAKPSFRAAFKSRRCLIPASGFYEWKALKGGKQPYCIRPKAETIFVFAGLYEHWQSESGKQINSCSILVTEAKEPIRQVHDRMPVILSPESYTDWLDPETQDPQLLKSLLTNQVMPEAEIYPVSKRINNPRNEDVDCLKRVELSQVEQ